MKFYISLFLFLITSLDAFGFTVYELHEDGNKSLLSTSWTIFDSAPAGGTELVDHSGGAGTNWSLKLGDFNFTDEDDIQDSGIYGAYTTLAPAYGYEIVFRFDGYTWDAYNGGPTDEDFDEFGGYFDLFTVNLNQEDSYENLVEGGFGLIADPVVPVDPAGDVVISENTSDPDSLPGKTWAWGGHDYTPYYYEELHGLYSMKFFGDNSSEYFLNLALDTTDDDYVPSWGCIGFWNDCGIAPPEFGDTENPLGDSPVIGVPEPAPLVLMALSLWILISLRRKLN